MQEAIIILSLLGCDYGERSCHYIDTATAHYQSVADCQDDAARALLVRSDADYPVVMAKCEMQAPVMVVEERQKMPMPRDAVAVAISDDGQGTWFVVQHLSKAVDYASPVAVKAGAWLSEGYNATGEFASVAWSRLPLVD